MLEQFWAFIASAIVGVIAVMGVVKSVWKPKVKQLYLIPASVLALGASYLAFLIVGVAFVWYYWLGVSLIILGDELLLQNEMWPAVTETYSKFRTYIKDLISGKLKQK